MKTAVKNKSLPQFKLISSKSIIIENVSKNFYQGAFEAKSGY